MRKGERDEQMEWAGTIWCQWDYQHVVTVCYS